MTTSIMNNKKVAFGGQEERGMREYKYTQEISQMVRAKKFPCHTDTNSYELL